MLRKFLLLLALLWLVPILAHAQNVTCATRLPGDSTNACASTAFVASGFQPTLPSFVANLPLIGNGTNVPAQGTRSGNTTAFATVDGAVTSGQCAVFDASGGLLSIACTPSGSGNVSAGTIGQLAIYTGTTTVAGATPVQAAAIVNPSRCTDAGLVGFVGNGSTANDAAWTAWVASIPSAGACLQFGAGIYVFTGTSQTFITLGGGNTASVSILGLGSNLTFLKFTNTFVVEGIVIEYTDVIRSNFHLRDMTIETTAEGAGVGFGVTNATGVEDNFAPSSDIMNVDFKGGDLDTSPGTSNECWITAIQIFAVSSVYMYNVNTYGTWGAPGSAGCGTGLLVEGDSTNHIYATTINIVNSTFNLHANGWLLEGYWQGITCTLCDWNGEEGTTCVDVPSGEPGVLVLLNINNSQLNCKGPQIFVQTNIFNLLLNNNVISPFGTNSVGIQANSSQSTINGNVINNTGAATGVNGIAVTGISNGGMITGNTFVGLSGGIIYNSGIANWNNQSNTFSSVTAPVTNNCGASCKSGGGSP